MTHDIPALFGKYRNELFALSNDLAPLAKRMNAGNFGTTFGDAEGEILYMLIREERPETVFEISPNAGWSTNYILAALTKNEYGAVHSFELQSAFGGVPTEDVIRRHQRPEADQGRLHIHIGDACKRVKEVPSEVQFLLLDSCHDDWFAQWYVQDLLPRVRGTVMIQDIAFADSIEPQSEARYVWKWMQEQRVPAQLIGQIERQPAVQSARLGLSPRRPLRSNAVIFPYPFSPATAGPVLDTGVESFIAEASQALEQKKNEAAKFALNAAVALLVSDVSRTGRHRQFSQSAKLFSKLRLGEDASRCMRCAFADVMQSDVLQRRKELPRLAASLAKQREWRLLLQAIVAAICEPGTRLRTVRELGRLLLP